jgi:hypothetical protein
MNIWGKTVPYCTPEVAKYINEEGGQSSCMSLCHLIMLPHKCVFFTTYYVSVRVFLMKHADSYNSFLTHAR